MNTENTEFLLTCKDGMSQGPVLSGVEAHGQLDGVLFELMVRQTYRNTSDRNLEVVYTFPLPSQAVLLGFASELNGARMQGQVVRRREAEQRYEQALSEGDAPVMLESLGDGLHTANIGNLQAGDELVIELRFAQLLCFEQGRLRLSIPTTIAPRFGDPAGAGLQPQQAPQVSLTAAYPLDLSIRVGKAFDGMPVECATHRMAMEPQAQDPLCRLYRLEPGARLDRDVVLNIQVEGQAPSLLVTSQDLAAPAAGFVAMAAFQPQVEAPRSSIALKLLVDCSGSMAGDSMASARSVLKGVLGQLSDEDSISLTRFGSTIEHVKRPTRAVAETRHGLMPAITRMEADLGGTEMASALGAVFALKAAGQEASKDVLLLTDGEIWEADAVIARARASQHRVFVIGLGASPAEGVLRRLAEATGGAAEFVTPGEALEAAARRMLARMRQPRYSSASVEWGTQPVWQTQLPGNVYGGDTVVAFAGFASPCALAPRLAAQDEQGQGRTLASTERVTESSGSTLPRMAAARRMAQCEGEQALALALSHQLLSAQTHCILVHVRDADDKAADEAQLHQVSSMLAAGWGATATVMAAGRATPAMAAPARDAGLMFSMRRGGAPADGGARSGVHFSDAAAPISFSRKQASIDDHATLRELAEAVLARLLDGHAASLDPHCRALDLHDDLRAAIDEVTAKVPEPSLAWLLLAHWVNTRSGGLHDAALAKALAPELGRLDGSAIDAALRVFDRSLGLYGLDDWTSSRLRRLGRSLRQIVA